ncbi:MAG TPA: acyl-[ACP]--phospholipid O-acyltransferase [Vicinamibacterales bacterium]|nr:acyl-[ACP]--phospholipid O-acyltransferase [Vicinamibacterales bacterium]
MTAGSYRTTLAIPGIRALLGTQLLGAFNDNVLRMIVLFYSVRTLGPIEGPAVVGAVFILPFLLFSGWAGHLADTRSKRTVLVVAKLVEVLVMLVAIPLLVQGALGGLLALVFAMATQSTFFGPAKYGVVPELVPDRELSRVNGLLEMTLFGAIIAGTWLGAELFVLWADEPWRLGTVLVAIAIGGALTSLGLSPVPAAKPDQPAGWNPWHEIAEGMARLWPDRTLWITAVGLAYFWFLGALLQLTLLEFGATALGADEAAQGRLYMFLAAGIGVGSLVAGRLSGDKIELGLVPLGAFGLGLSSFVLVGAAPSYGLAALVLVALGACGGLFAVPLNALIQQQPSDDEKGRVLATTGFLGTVGILLASVVFWLLGSVLALPASAILTTAGVFTLASSVYVLWRVPRFFVRFVLWLLTHTFYRIRIVGRPNIPARGPALLIVNHLSLIDGALVGASLQRFVRFLVWGPYYRSRLLHPVLRHLHAIPVEPGDRRAVLSAVARAREELQAGHVVCVFVEGAVSRSGNLLPIKRGFERIVSGLDVPVIPVYLDGVWGSIFSFKHGRVIWKWPSRVPYPVTVAFGEPLPSTVTAAEARIALMATGGRAMAERRGSGELLHTEFMRVARRRWGQFAMADSTGQRLTYGRTLIGMLAFARAIDARCRPAEAAAGRRPATSGATPHAPAVGILLPASVGAALANLGVLASGRIPVNLNFTIGPDAMTAAIAEAGIRVILTSRRFLDKATLPELPGMVFLEDVRTSIGTGARIRALLAARLLPLRMLRRLYGGAAGTSDSLATIIFSSGSTGVPKGVLISHRNVLANVDALEQIFPMGPTDRFLGVLPFFHSFGFTGTFWFPLLQGAGAVYHPNPMDARTVGELCGEHKVTMLVSTPTFCASYLRRVSPEEFAHLRFAIVGAEKLRAPLARAFREKYGIDLLEGYGCTEMSPVVAVNRPDVVVNGRTQVGTKAGSVGHPIPGVSAMVVDQATGEGPLVGREGLLLVTGPNLMQGYLNQPERTAEVMRDGWYVTGDIASIDEDGFIFITDRLSRFSKIGGEMVPHVRIEEAINELLDEACCAVTAVPDESKGERLVVFLTRADVTAETLWDALCRTELPRLWIPKRDGLFHVDAIPTLGTGKVDLRKLRELAVERVGKSPGILAES